MIEHPTSGTASRTVADRQNGLIAGSQVTVISGSTYSPGSAAIAVPTHTSKKTDDVRRFRVGPLVAVATATVGPLLVAAMAAVVAISLSTAPDRPLSLDGAVSGHSVLHFPR